MAIIFCSYEGESACFNGAASAAVSYYRRAGDQASAERVRRSAATHPSAATQWASLQQTPRVFHASIASARGDPGGLTDGEAAAAVGLTARPWWDASRFTAAKILKGTCEKG